MSSFSKLAKKPISIPQGVQIEMSGDRLVARCGSLEGAMPASGDVVLKIEDGQCSVSASSTIKNKAMVGTFAANLRNLLRDVKTPYKVYLNLIGVGYKAFNVDGGIIALSVGFSHLVAFKVPEGIGYSIKDNTEIELSGFVNEVTAFADDVCKCSPWDPCLQSGIVVKGSFLRKKEGKKK